MMDAINITAFLFGLISLILTIIYGNKARNSYHLLMNNFEQKSVELLIKTLEKEGLRNSGHVLGIITNISIEYSIDMPSDEFIVRILRRIALKYQYKGAYSDKIKKALDNLETIRKEIEPKGLPLASISSVNRFTALQLIIGVLIISFFIFLSYNILNFGNRWLTIATVGCEFLFLVIMVTVSNRLKGLCNKYRSK